jgi:uncharacterized protein
LKNALICDKFAPSTYFNKSIDMSSPFDLTQEMIEELDEFLMSDNSPEDSFLLSDLDGFLTGIVVGPDLILPGEWVPVIWGDGEPDFNDEEHAERILGIIMARYNEIIFQLDNEPESFQPIFYSAPDGRTVAADWVEGFMDAFGLRVDSWDPLLADVDFSYLMGPIMAFLSDKDGNSLVTGTPEELDIILAESTEALPHVIKEIYDYWKERRVAADDNIQSFGKKVGRNDRCPCGSGRKYKQCCGAN